MDDYESLSANTTSCSFPSTAGRRCMQSCDGTWGRLFRKLAEQKESRIEEGHLLLDHVHMLISIPPKYAVSQVIGFIRERVPYTWLAYTARRSGIS